MNPFKIRIMIGYVWRKVLFIILNQRLLREKVIFHLKQYYYSELEFKVGIGNELVCPIADPSAQYSLTEIFFDDEYKQVFDFIDLPKRWLDLGCHYGFFSLYVAGLARRNSRSAFYALLVDADSRVYYGIDSLIRLNCLKSSFIFKHGAVAAGSGEVSFLEQDVMSSSLADLTTETSRLSAKAVPIIDQDVILSLLAPPYDLVKIDVEGGEYDFFVFYDKILANTKNIVVEWHSWHRGGGGKQQIVELAESRGFRLLKEVQQDKVCGNPGDGIMVGVLLFTKPDETMLTL
jgi:FkbM family methyltransferase